jgi:hypothetical protein
MPINTLKNEPTGNGVSPTPIFIDDSSYRLAYRSYNGTVESTNICSLIPPTTPSVIQQWNAEEGQIEITTTATYVPNNTGDGSTRIDGYNHYITIKNVTYPAPGSTVKVTVPEVIIGNFKTAIKAEDKLDLVFDESANQCSTSGQVYNFNSSTSLTIDDIDPALLLNASTPANDPRRGLLSATKNKLLLRVYNGLLTEGYFCTSPVPTTPTLKETWVGQPGEDKISGIIEVTSTTYVGSTFKHTIVLKNVKLQKGNNVFNLGNTFLLGELIK